MGFMVVYQEQGNMCITQNTYYDETLGWVKQTISLDTDQIYEVYQYIIKHGLIEPPKGN